MIIPAGKRREQVAQGPLKHQSFLDDDMFKKFAIASDALIDNPVIIPPVKITIPTIMDNFLTK